MSHSNDNHEPTVFSRYGGGRAEEEANWFAMAFLMPEDAFREQWEVTQGDLDKMARVFGLNTREIHIRAITLDLLPKDSLKPL